MRLLTHCQPLKTLKIPLKLACTGGDAKSIAAIDGLELSPEEKFEFLRRLEGPIYTIKGVPRPLLIRLNEFVLSCIDQSYVQYDVKAPSSPFFEYTA